ncbi:MAG: four helix bundle protein [Ferruginibacter sp.]|jgi:four helix bundle protein
MKVGKGNVIVEKTFEFALNIIQYVEILERNRRYVIARQLLRSATSIGANVREAQNAESRADFIHKMKVAAKETEESEYWLELCQYSPGYPDPGELTGQCFVVKKIISAIIGSTRKMTKQK